MRKLRKFSSKPKMQIIEWNLEVDLVGGDRSGTFEIEADATDEEINQVVKDEIANYVSWGWSKKEVDDD